MRHFEVWTFRDGRRWLVRAVIGEPWDFYFGFYRFIKELAP